MATHLLVNPRAGSGERGLEFWRCRLAASGVALSGCWEVGEDWQHLVESGDDLLVAGGDGTWHALLGECMRRSLRLGLLPSGTGNDLARSLGVPLDPQGAVEVIAAGGVRLIDLAEADGAFFVNVLHIGAGATVSRTVATSVAGGVLPICVRSPVKFASATAFTSRCARAMARTCMGVGSRSLSQTDPVLVAGSLFLVRRLTMVGLI